MKYLCAPRVAAWTHGRPALLGPVAVVQGKCDLQKDVPDAVLVQRGAAALRLADKGAEVARRAVLHDNVDALVLGVADFLHELHNVAVLERLEDGDLGHYLLTVLLVHLAVVEFLEGELLCVSWPRQRRDVSRTESSCSAVDALRTLPSSIRWILEMTPKLPLPMLLTRRYLSISLGSAKDADVGDADERREEAMVGGAGTGWWIGLVCRRAGGVWRLVVYAQSIGPRPVFGVGGGAGLWEERDARRVDVLLRVVDGGMRAA